MIIYHQNNIAGFVGAHKWYTPLQTVIYTRITVTSAAPLNELIEQARSISRFTFTRLFGRIN